MSARMNPGRQDHADFKPEEKRVIFASSLGTVFEWYDFYLYATLAPFFAALFFPQGQRDRGAALGLRHLRRRLPGAAVRRAGLRPHRRPRRPQVHLPRHHRGDGRLDLRGRPAADLSRRSAGRRPILLVTLRLLQGLALGGEYGGAATYVAEHAPNDRRGYDTSWIQTTATLGFFLSLLVIGVCRVDDGRRRPSPSGAGACRSWCR